MTFTIHRGANEIGGSCVEVCTAKTRLVVDIGLPLVNADGTSFDSSVVEDISIHDLVNQKILPDIPALYDSADDKETAVIISHAHQDHYGLIRFVNKNIPVYLGKATHSLIELTAVFSGKGKVINDPRYFESYQKFNFGDIEITPYLMDHAAFDAYAFLIAAEGKSLVYTGDFRAHGRKWKLFYKFLHIAPKNVDYLLMEGTTLSRSKNKSPTEEELENQFVKTFKETKGISLVYVSGQNIDRLVTIFRSCRRSGRLFVIDFYIAAILTELAELGSGVPYPSPNFPEVWVFFPKLLRSKMEKLGRSDIIERFTPYEITREELSEKAKQIAMTVRSSMSYEIKGIDNLNGGILVYSMWEGYKESPSNERFFTNIVKRGAVITTIHTSGHADYAALQKLAAAVQPKKLVPIHTTEGDNYQKLFPEYCVERSQNDSTTENIKDEKAAEMTLFDHFEKIGNAHEKSGIMPDYGFDEFLERIRPHIDVVCTKLRINEIQAIFFSDLIVLTNGYEISIKSLSEFIGCKPIKILKCLSELRTLEAKKLINILEEIDPFEKRSCIFEIAALTMDALQNNQLPEEVIRQISTIDDFFTKLAAIWHNRYEKIKREIDLILEESRHLEIAKKIQSYDLMADDIVILLGFCHYLVNLDIDEIDFEQLRRFRLDEEIFYHAKRYLKAGDHPFQKKGLIQNVNNDGFGDAETFCLTDKAKDDLLFEINEQLKTNPVHGLKAADTITAKNLFYPAKTARQVEELTGLLQENNFSQVHKRLSGEGLRTGFACLFSGGPGTGKTETAYQIARKTGRGIMQVDIADTKSMWFGESEKKIKKVFNRYRSAVKRSNIVPILLFNEADAVIGKRQNLGESRNGPGQTENAIQNIILQEIENLNGILIATTNLVKNMDKAFERRFLYKIEFEKPALETRKSIWQAIIPALTPEETDVLASQFEFSGGQIENIARRRTVADILYGSPPTLEKLLEYCKEEMSEESTAKKIGFVV